MTTRNTAARSAIRTLAAGAVAIGLVWVVPGVAPAAPAVNAEQPHLVSANPADWTPNVTDGQVRMPKEETGKKGEQLADGFGFFDTREYDESPTEYTYGVPQLLRMEIQVPLGNVEFKGPSRRGRPRLTTR